MHTNNNCRTVEPKLKHRTAGRTPNGSTDIKTRQLEMNEIVAANRSSAVDFSAGHKNANDSENMSSAVNNQNDKILSADDDNLLPNQTVMANEV